MNGSRVVALDNGSEDGNNGGKLEALRRQFFVDEDLITSRLEELAAKVRRFCTVDKRGNVHVSPEVKGAKSQIQVALSARAVAARLNSEIQEDVSVVELAEATGLAKDVVSARCGELVKSRDIDSSRRGTFRIQQDRIERFLNSLATA
jgi:hypothetical protein